MSQRKTLVTSGTWDVRRRLPLPGLRHAADGMKLEQVLQKVEGVKGVIADTGKHSLLVAYDVTRTDYRSLCGLLEGEGFPVKDNWLARIRGNWYQYLDTTGRDNAHVPEPPCCSNPKGINSGGKRSH